MKVTWTHTEKAKKQHRKSGFHTGPSRDATITTTGNNKEYTEKGNKEGCKNRGLTWSGFENKIKETNDRKAFVCGLCFGGGATGTD